MKLISDEAIKSIPSGYEYERQYMETGDKFNKIWNKIHSAIYTPVINEVFDPIYLALQHAAFDEPNETD